MDSNLGFGLAFALEDKFSATSQNIRNEFNRFEQSANRLSEKVESSMNRAYKGFGQVAAGVAILLPLKNILDSFIEYDSLERGMVAVMGSVQRARGEIEKLREGAKLPGLGYQEAIGLSTQLQAARMDSDLARRSLLLFGNAIAQVGKGRTELFGVVEALRKITTNGVNGMYINQISKRLPQFVGILKDAFGTAVPKEIAKMGLSSTQFVEKVLGQLSKLKRVDGGIGNAIENMKDAVWRMEVAFGRTFAPFVEDLANKLGDIFSAFEKFAGTKLGAAIIKVTTFGAALLGSSFVLRGLKNIFGGLGGVISAATYSFSLFSSAMTFNISKMVGGFASLGKSLKAFIIANPVAIAFLAIGAAVSVVNKALNSFDSYVNGQEKTVSFWVKLGGVINGIGAIINSVTNAGWSMSEELRNQLDKIGVLDTVRKMGTWAVRLRAFWQGLSSTVGAAFEYVKEKVSVGLGYLGINLDKLTSNLEKWRKVGVFVGGAVVAALAIVTASLLVTAASALVAGAAMLLPMLPYIALAVLVSGAIYLIYKGFEMLWQGAKWAWNNIIFYSKVAWHWLIGLGGKAFTWGSNFVTNIWNGVKSMWTGFRAWIYEKWNDITSLFGRAFSFDTQSKHTNNIETTTSEAQQGTQFLNGIANDRALSNSLPYELALSRQQPQTVISTQRTETLKTVQLDVHLDGKKLSKNVFDNFKLDDARSGL